MGLLQRLRREKERPEEIARALVDAICTTYKAMQEEQNTLLLELSYTARDRFTLSLQLAEALYTTGLPGYPRRKLQKYMTEGELQAVLYCLVCGDTYERIVRQAVVRLLQRPDFQHYATHQSKPRRRSSPTTETSASPEGDGEMPSLLLRDRQARRGILSIRTRRPGGRTGRDHRLPVSES